MNIDAVVESARLARRKGSPAQSFVQGTYIRSERCIETYKGEHDKRNQKLTVANAELPNPVIDISWLSSAAETYKISADPRDYVIVEVPIVTADIPNRNLQAFPFEELSYFDPLYGCMIYNTFVGKPTHIDHENKDPLKAKGVIFDAHFRYVPEYNTWKVFTLCGYDRTKDSELTDDIISKRRTGYSMGALVENFVCSISGQVDTNIKPSRYTKGSVYEGLLSYQLCVGVNFIEVSSVEDPADTSAITDIIW